MIIFSALLISYAGCKDPAPSNTRSDTAPKGNTQQSKGLVIEGQPKLTEDVEKEIYKSLNYRRKMIKSIREGAGSVRGIQQMQDELDLLTKGFMGRYNLNQAEIDRILKKGESQNWE